MDEFFERWDKLLAKNNHKNRIIIIIYKNCFKNGHKGTFNRRKPAVLKHKFFDVTQQLTKPTNIRGELLAV